MKEKIKAIAIRTIYTVCETALGTIGGCKLISEVNWKLVLSASLLAGICCVLKSIAVGLPELEGK